MNRRLCALLAALLLLAACGGSEDEDEALTYYDFVENNFQGDETILTIDGDPVTITEYFYVMNLVVSSVIGDSDLDSVNWYTLYNDMTLSEYLSAQTLSQLKHYHAAKTYAEGLGCGLTEEQEEAVAAVYASAVESIYEQYDGYSDLAAEIVSLYMPEEPYGLLTAYDYYLENLAEHLYGPDSGKEPTEEEIVSFFDDAGYYRAVYLYFSYLDEDGDLLDDEAREEKLTRAGEILDELENTSDPAARLQTYIADEGEDEVMAELADGYYFTADDVDAEFLTIISALKENEVSQIYEAEDGCLIAARLPLDADYLEDAYIEQQLQTSLLSIRTSATVVYSDIYPFANARSYCQWVVYQTEG